MATVALIGPDGAGKTTIARQLEARQPLPLKYLYMGVNAESGNVTLPTTRLLNALRRRVRARRARSLAKADPKPRPHGESPSGRRRGVLWSAARLLHHLSEEWYRQLACWCCQLSGKLVVCDRHFVFDYAPGIGPAEEGFDHRVRRWVFTRLYPMPDLVIFLDAPGQVLFARKGEADIPELERRRRTYLAVGQRLDRFVRVDATLPLEAVYDQVVAQIIGFQSHRTQRKNRLRQSSAGVGKTLQASRLRADAIRTRFFYKALDAALTAELRTPVESSRVAGRVRRTESSYDRVRRYARATSSALPGAARRIRRSLLRPTMLPFRGSPELIGCGSGSTVFKLDALPSGAPKVLKVYRRTLGQRGEALEQLAREFKTKYATISGWYQGVDVVVPSHFIVLHSPLRACSAVACMQPYIEGGGDDFLSRPDENIRALLRTHAQLRRQFHAFVVSTLRVLERERRCPDLLGYGNLTTEWEDATPRLWLLDFGIFDLRPDSGTPASTLRRLSKLVERIEALDASVR